MTAELVEAYTRLAKARKEAKEEYKRTLPEKLRPHMIELGLAVERAQADGIKIAEIARVIGVKYRNVIYDAKRAAAEHLGQKPNIRKQAPAVRVPNEKQEDSTVQDSVSQDEETQEYNIVTLEGGNYEVYIWGEEYLVNTDERTGRVIFPEEWADASPAQRAIYKKIVKQIEAGEAA